MKISVGGKRILLKIPILALFFLTDIRCVRKIENNFSLGYEYFPQDSGMIKIYEVWDTSFTTSDTIFSHYFRKEVYLGWEYDLMGRKLQRVEIYQSDSLNGEYQYQFLWTFYRGIDHAERIEGTVRYVVLWFPVELGRKWDGNQYNAFESQFYRYLSVDTFITLSNGKQFGSCVWVQQKGPEITLLSSTNTYEIYARNIGIVYRYDKNLIWDFDENGQKVLNTSSYFRREELVELKP